MQRQSKSLVGRRLAVSFLVLLLLVLNVTFTFGEKTIDEVVEEIDTTQEEIDKNQEKKEDLQGELNDLQKKIDDTQADIDVLSAEVASLQLQINENQRNLEAKEEELKANAVNLNGRLRNMYKNGAIGFVDVLLSSETVTDLISNVEMVGRIYSSDRDLISVIEEEYEGIKALQDSMTAQRQDLDGKVAELNSLQQQLSDSYASVETDKEEVEAHIHELETDLHDLQAEAAQIQSYMSTSVEYTGSNNYNGSGSGFFSWPVPGNYTVTSEYAWRNCPYHGLELHSGIDISAGYGTPVVSAADGIVIAAGDMGGYGNAVLISHGNGLYSLYGHNQSLNVYAGQTVSRGQTIAYVGSTGNSTGPHCHFEVRVGGSEGSTVNPRDYL